jgi:hypothetical protein
MALMALSVFLGKAARVPVAETVLSLRKAYNSPLWLPVKAS